MNKLTFSLLFAAFFALLSACRREEQVLLPAPVSLGSISGTINCMRGNPMPNVKVKISGPQYFPVFTTTDANGNYKFSNLPFGLDYEIAPEKTATSGLTTEDLIPFSQLAFDSMGLHTSFQLLAGDLNNSGSVTVLDLVNARQTIIGTLPPLLQWRFASDDFQFPNPGNPAGAGSVDVIRINALAASWVDVNFVGVRTGDVQGRYCEN